MTRLEIAQKKLNRIDAEIDATLEAERAHYGQTHGSPVNDKGNAGAFFQRAAQIRDKGIRLLRERDSQKARIKKLEEREIYLAAGLNKNGTLATAVSNLEEIKARGGSYNRKRAKELEIIIAKAEKDALTMTAGTRAIIESGAVSKWEKKPMYYFVKGARKTALLIDKNGEFEISKQYPATSEKDAAIVKRILEGDHAGKKVAEEEAE
ncbi:MAG: hypothetical protein FWE09_00215 [Treponema sp.]|nr:hypothetical protein [Treponema sp.]